MANAKKVEPKAHAISVDRVANIGLEVVRVAGSPAPALDKGRGFMGPAPVSHTTSNCGSQGKH